MDTWEGKLYKFRAPILVSLCFVLAMGVQGEDKAPLKLSKTIPLADLHEGDFDHFAVDRAGNRLFATAEENAKVEVFDLQTNKLIHTISDLKAPHSMLYRADLKKLFVVDGDLGEIKVYDDSYQALGSIKLRPGADSSVYDPSTNYLYVVDGGDDGHLPNAFISVVDTSTAKKVGEIKVDSDKVEAMAIEKSGPRLFVDVRGNNTIEVFDRQKRTLLGTWPVAQQAKNPTAIAFDEAGHRLFIGTREPGKLIVIDSDSGKVVTSVPAVSWVDDMTYDGERKRIYFAGSEYVDVFEQRDPDHYSLIGHVPTAFRAKTAILIPELNRYYLAVPQHEKESAAVRVYNVLP